MERFYLDYRPGAVALRDREYDTDPLEFGPYAPGVMAFVKATVGEDGSLSIDDRHLKDHLLSDLLSQKRETLAWAAVRHQDAAKQREYARQSSEFHRKEKVRQDWLAATKNAYTEVLEKYGNVSHNETGKSLCLYAGPITESYRLIMVSVDLTNCSYTWGNLRRDRAALGEVVKFAPVLETLLFELEAVGTRCWAARPEEFRVER
jgi:hypothetical protein